MTKEQLKAAIRKVLEKEGGAAGMKALKKQTDASEEDIKSSIKDDEKVGQHPDKDYILAKGKISVSEMVEEELMNYLYEKKRKKRKKEVITRTPERVLWPGHVAIVSKKMLGVCCNPTK